MFDPLQDFWDWVVGSTPFTGGWIAVVCLLIAVPVGLRQAIKTWKRDHEEIQRSGRPPGLRGKDWPS